MSNIKHLLFRCKGEIKKMWKLGLSTTLMGTIFTFLFGTWTPLMGVLLVMIGLDIITGITKGFYDKALRSRKMHQGMIRKAMIFVVLIIANMLDVAMFNGMPVVKSAVLAFYIGMEGLSILENLGQMNVPLPNFVKTYLLVLKDKGQAVKETETKE